VSQIEIHRQTVHGDQRINTAGRDLYIGATASVAPKQEPSEPLRSGLGLITAVVKLFSAVFGATKSGVS
jgi:hypothetical protein